MDIRIASTAAEAAEHAANFIAQALREAIAARGTATIAFSGGSSPRALLETLAREPLDWAQVQVFQVDERMVPRDDPARNLDALERCLVQEGPLPAGNLHVMPVEPAETPAPLAAYEATLAALAGFPPHIDLVQLGLGTDGHTASLFPGDPALGIVDRDLAFSAEHAGYRRMTFTLPLINRARAIAWFASGAAKAPMIAALVAGDSAVPCGRVARDRAHIFIDKAAAAALPTS
jgi:6-phosphogluconolactonase